IQSGWSSPSLRRISSICAGSTRVTSASSDTGSPGAARTMRNDRIEMPMSTGTASMRRRRAYLPTSLSPLACDARRSDALPVLDVLHHEHAHILAGQLHFRRRGPDLVRHRQLDRRSVLHDLLGGLGVELFTLISIWNRKRLAEQAVDGRALIVVW